MKSVMKLERRSIERLSCCFGFWFLAWRGRRRAGARSADDGIGNSLPRMHPPAVCGAMAGRLRSVRWHMGWSVSHASACRLRCNDAMAERASAGVVRAEGLFVVAYGVAAVVDGDIPDFAAEVFAFGAGYIESDYIVSVVLGVLMHGVLFGRGGAVAEIPFP